MMADQTKPAARSERNPGKILEGGACSRHEGVVVCHIRMEGSDYADC